MTAAAELDSFMSKFKQLLSAGLDAHLAAGARAGQAWVSLRVGLGQQPARSDRRHKRNGGPSRDRRCARREAARQDAGNVGCVNGQHSTEDPIAEEAIEVDEVETLPDGTEDAPIDAEQGKVDGNPKSNSVANTEVVKLVVAKEVSDEIENVEIETIEEELVMIFGEYTSEEPFDHEYYFGAIKKTLENSISYFHYDGTYWKEKEGNKKNTTGFYQTVRLKPGIYRSCLYDARNWPGGTQIVELRKKDEHYLKPW